MRQDHLQHVLKIDASRRFVKKYLGIIALLISLVIVTVFFAFNAVTTSTIVQQFEDEGSSFFDEILNVRLWLSNHGGVYVPLDTAGGVNKYLKDIVGVDAIIECDGRTFTLKNPALVTRELSESTQHGDRLKYKITSLNLMNPDNAPDSFEADSLRKFQQGATHTTTIAEMDGKTYFRYMAPLKTVEPCLKCHAKQGYKVGEIRGGIAVSILADDVNNKLFRARTYMILGGFAVIALVVFSILYVARYFIKDLQTAQDKLAEMALTDARTGLYNRLTGIGMLKKEIARASRNGNSRSLAILDVDFFKKINDTTC